MNLNEGLYQPNLPIPKGWRRVQLGEKTQKGDREIAAFGGTAALSMWDEFHPHVASFTVTKASYPIIRKELALPEKAGNVHRPDISDKFIPEGWSRLSLGTLLEDGDRFRHFNSWDAYPCSVKDWFPVPSIEFLNKTVVVPDGAICIRKKPPVQADNGVAPAPEQKKDEEKIMSKITHPTLTALLTLRAGEPTETLPGCDGEGVFAQALKDAELKRRETALKALTEVAIEIQNAFAAAKEGQRAEIRRAQAVIEKAKVRLNVLDAAAELLKSANPNPFPLLNELGMVTRHDLALSVEEFAKLVAVPAKN